MSKVKQLFRQSMRQAAQLSPCGLQSPPAAAIHSQKHMAVLSRGQLHMTSMLALVRIWLLTSHIPTRYMPMSGAAGQERCHHPSSLSDMFSTLYKG